MEKVIEEGWLIKDEENWVHPCSRVSQLYKTEVSAQRVIEDHVFMKKRGAKPVKAKVVVEE